MLQNIFITKGVIFSQRVLSTLIEKGLSREEAYDIVQPLAMKAWEKKIEFIELLQQNKTVVKLIPDAELIALFLPDYFLRNVDTIYERVGLL